MDSGGQNGSRAFGHIGTRRKGSAVVGENRTEALTTQEELTTATSDSPPSISPVQDERPCGDYRREACIPRNTSFSSSSSSSCGPSSSCSYSSQRDGICFDPTWEKIPLTSDFDKLLNQVLIRCHQQSALIPTSANLRSIAISLGFGFIEADDFLVSSAANLPLALDKCLTVWRRSCGGQDPSDMEERLYRAIRQSGSERLFEAYRGIKADILERI